MKPLNKLKPEYPDQRSFAYVVTKASVVVAIRGARVRTEKRAPIRVGDKLAPDEVLKVVYDPKWKGPQGMFGVDLEDA